MSPIAFFDVDGTLLHGYSGYYTTLELVRRNILKKRKIPWALFYKVVSYFYHFTDVKKIYQGAIEDMAGMRLEEVLEIGREIFERDLRPRLYVEGLEAVQKHKKQGHSVILISSGPGMVILPVQEYVGAQLSFSIGPVIENQVLQNRLKEPLAFMEGKQKIAEAEAKKQGLTLKECYFYSDAYHDVALLSAVRHPRVVNPDRALRREAERKGWPILQFKKLVGGQQPGST